MKKKLLLIHFTLISAFGYSQTLDFTKANPQPNLMEAYGGTFASGDIDGDGDKDLFMTGITPQIWTKLYFNDGLGNFTEASHNFPRSGSSQAFFKDLDNDGDLDLFFSGSNQLNQTFTHIYRNNGTGVFTQVVNNALPIFLKGATIDDIDNDGDQDIIVSAQTSSGNYVADVYLNNGDAIFTAQGSVTFTAVKGVLKCIDIENDGDKDVLISGKDANNVSSVKLYQNNGLGVFTLNTNSTFAALNGEDIDVADTDNDGDLDILLNGNTQNLLYLNNGSGVFTLTSTNLQQTFGGQNAFSDLDNDGDQDMLIVGTQAGGLPNIYNIVYQNTGNNVFVQTEVLGGEYIADCVVDDFNGDGLKDIIIQGFADDTNVYWNTSTTLSSTEIDSNQEVRFYPNPANNFVYFNLNETIENITLYNLLGQEVFSKNINAKEFAIDVSNLSNGTYVATLNATKKRKTLKFIKF